MRDPEAPHPLTTTRALRWTALAVVLLAIAHALDPLAHHTLRLEPRALARSDAAWTARIAGYWPLWLAVAALFYRDDRRRFRLGHTPAHLVDPASRALLLTLGAGLAGLAAEAVKLASKRARPPNTHDWPGYHWRWNDAEHWTSTTGVGFVSSHTAVAFGAAFVIAKLHPTYAAPALALAAACAWQRVAQGAHYLSDTVAAALVAYLTTQLLWRAHWRVLRKRRNPQTP